MTDEKAKDRATIEQAFRHWNEETVAKAVKRFPERRDKFVTASGTEVERLYIPASCAASAYLDELGFPGQYPYTRGIQPTMYRGRLWTMRQYAGFGTAEETNKRFRYLLDQGSTGLSVAFDLPTQIGYDSDDPIAKGEVGRVGVAVSTLEDMERLFNGIPLDKVSTSMTINATAAILLAMYIAVAEKQHVLPEKLEGTVQNDILKEYFARGTYRFPPEPSLRLTSDIITYCAEHLPRWNAISISGYHMREAGSTPAQEIAFTMADAICYIETALKTGLDIDAFAPRLTFFFASHTDLFEVAAKFRAARRLYARLMRERFHAQDPKSMMLRFHTQTGGVTLTAQQPENNVVRVTVQALAAVLGGTQSLHTNSKDEALTLPAGDAVRLALRTQQILAHETGVTNTVDPLGGSYFVEHLTDRLEAEAQHYINAIDELGGMVSAIEQGYVRDQIEQSAYEQGRAIENGERIIVGVNSFQEHGGYDHDVSIFRVPEDTKRKQIEQLTRVKAGRDAGQVRQALAAVEEAARGTANLMPCILGAVRAYASVGEICTALQNVFGEFTESIDLHLH
jgi:methylmalonyl-CoA mutase N-terminal domain/subunit